MIQFIIAAEEAAPNPILPEPIELIVGAIVFLIVFAALAKFAFPSLNAMLAARTDRIQGELERAEQTHTEARNELESYRRQVAGAREEANRIVEEARRAADQIGYRRRAALVRDAGELHAPLLLEELAELSGLEDREGRELLDQLFEISHLYSPEFPNFVERLVDT